tara:strand:- start:262 stop:1332 length:1071 start_codon:yes stop_codon:yes gene_type:complete
MSSLYIKTLNYLDNSKASHLGIYFSLFFHLSILLFAIGLPDFFKPKPILIPQVIPIEILNVSDVTSIKPMNDEIEINNNQNKKIKQKKFNSSENTEIQKVDLQEKSNEKQINTNQNISDNKIITQKTELKKNSLKEKKILNINEEKIVKLDNFETLKIKKIKPKLKPKLIDNIEPKSDIQLENKPKPDKIVEKQNQTQEKPKIIQKPKQDFNLSTMLKDLRNEDISNILDESKDDEKIEENNQDTEEVNMVVSISEMDLVIQQLRGCFNPRAGTQIVGDEMVKIRAKIDRQAYVRKDTVQIIDTNISKSNPYYESITESALATLYNPLCSKLKLPLNKYESWKDLKITIDYSWIKN